MIQELEINVTQDHINRSEKSTMCHCPIALATNRRIEELGQKPIFVSGTSVTDKEATFAAKRGDDLLYFRFPLPKSAQKFIADRDSGEEIKPFSFTVKPQEYEPKQTTTAP